MIYNNKSISVDADLPSNIIAEQMLLGAALINGSVLESVMGFLKPTHFSHSLHGEIYASLLNLIEANITVTPLALKNLLENNEEFNEAGGYKYLNNLAILAIVVIDIRDYAQIIYDTAVKRQIIAISEEAIESAGNKSLLDDHKTQIEILENKIYQLINDDVIGKGFINSKKIVLESMENLSEIIKGSNKGVGVSSGFIDLDGKLGGLCNSDLIIIAGRPAMGKTAFALNLAINICKDILSKELDPSVGFFSLEMSSTDLINRVISMYSGVDSTRFIDGKINEESYNKIKKAAAEISRLPLFIDDSPALTISSIRSRARKLKRQYNLGILFIDYLQLIKCTEKMDNRTLEISEITRSLKALAKELGIPVVALSQLSRAVEQRVDKRPILSDLRESGSIEQDADVVMFIYREEYYLKSREPERNTEAHRLWVEKLNKTYNTAEIIITKHRKGPTGIINLYYDNKHSKFSNFNV